MGFNNSNDMHKAGSLIDSLTCGATVKRVKRDKGLMERTQSENIILEEDNRQVLFG